VNQHVKPPEVLPRFGEDGVQIGVVVGIGALHKGAADRLRQGEDALLQLGDGIAQADVGPGLVQRLGDSPGKGFVVGHAEDECVLAVHQAHGCLLLL